MEKGLISCKRATIVGQDKSAHSWCFANSDNASRFTMGVDATNIATGRGRDSVRISSKDKFNDVSYNLNNSLAGPKGLF